VEGALVAVAGDAEVHQAASVAPAAVRMKAAATNPSSRHSTRRVARRVLQAVTSQHGIHLNKETYIHRDSKAKSEKIDIISRLDSMFAMMLIGVQNGTRGPLDENSQTMCC
jgi:hypothetical protein